MADIFPNLKKETYIQIKEAQSVSNKINPKRPTSRHTVKMSKVKEDPRSSNRETKLIKKKPP